MRAQLPVIALLLLCGCGSRVVTPTSPSGMPGLAPPPVGTFTLSGTVRDAGNGNLLESVSVDAGAPLAVQTGFDGAFALRGLGGTVMLTVSRTGYATTTQTLNLAGDMSVAIELRRTAMRTAPCGDAPDINNRVLPLLSRPFNGEALLLNYFDHDLPQQFQDGNGFQLTVCGESVRGRVDGHEGYDWFLPVGTPLLATVDGIIVAAGPDPPFVCPPLGRVVADQLVVVLRSEADVVVDSQYLHLSRIDVVPGERVGRGQVIGLSGATGCATVPHLHFQVRAVSGPNPSALVDPYGWEGSVRDPWSLHPLGRESVWLWRPGQAPLLRAQ